MLRCPDCPRIGSPIPSSGPAPCPILFLGAKPGKVEAKTLVPYTGKAGEELDDTYLRRAGLRREEVHVGNCVLCYDGKDDQPSDKLTLSCARHHLPSLLRRVQPDVVVLMGGPPNRLVRLEDGGRIRLDMHHGRVLSGSLLEAWSGRLWPSYEPALGMRDTGRMTQILEDFFNLGRWLRGEWEPPVPNEVLKNYQLARSAKDVRNYFATHL